MMTLFLQKTDSSLKFIERKFFLILSETWCVVKIMIYLRRDVSFLALNSYQELPVHLNETYFNL